MEEQYIRYIYDKYILYHKSNNILDDNDIIVIFNKYKNNIYIKNLYELFKENPKLINPITNAKITINEYFNIYLYNKIKLIYNIQDISTNREFVLSINDKLDIKESPNKKYKKKSIPSTLRKLVWNKYIGEEKGKSKCLCCNTTDITQLSFHCGHIIPEINGGETNITNLRPICQNCNSSMGCKSMNDFMKLFN